MKQSLAVLAGFVLINGPLAWSLDAATFTATPARAADDPSNITLSVGGLPTHQTILVESFADMDEDGVIDATDPLVLSFQVTDGEVPLFGGVRDTNRPGDEDGLTNGMATVLLSLPQLPERCRIVGKYVLRVSAAGNPFSPVTAPFQVSSANQPQTISGTVFNGANPVPSAVVVVLTVSGDNMEFAGGAIADNSGHYSLAVPSGDYGILAFKDGYVADGAGSPSVSLQPNISTNQDVGVLPATRLISGRAFDIISSNGIAGLQLFFQSQDGFFHLAITDANGDFTAPVVAGNWEIDQSEKGLALLGYSQVGAHVDTTAGDVTGVSLALARARGEFQLVFFFPSGNFGTGTNGVFNFPTQLDYYYALYNVNDTGLPTNVFFTGPAGSGLNNTSSAIFGANYDGGSGFYSSPQVTVPAYPPGGIYEVNYKNEAQQFLIVDPDAGNHQVILQPDASVDPAGVLQSLTWVFRDTSGNLTTPPAYITQIEIRIDGAGGRLYDANLSPNTTSHSLQSSVQWTNVSSIQMVYDDDRGNQYVAFWQRGSQPLEILTDTLPNGRVDTAYHILLVAAGGWTPYSWSFVSGDLPAGVTFTPVTGELSGTPTESGSFQFTARVTDNFGDHLDQSYTLTVDPVSPPVELYAMPMAIGQFTFHFTSDPGRTYEVEYSTDLVNWLTLTTTNAESGSVSITDSGANGASRFYRAALMP